MVDEFWALPLVHCSKNRLDPIDAGKEGIDGKPCAYPRINNGFYEIILLDGTFRFDTICIEIVPESANGHAPQLGFAASSDCIGHIVSDAGCTLMGQFAYC